MTTRVLLIHGSAGDHTTWSIQLASPVLAQRFSLIAYDRPPLATVAEQAALALTYLDTPTLIVGSSFGAVIALEVIRHHPQLGAVLIEPPLGAPMTDFLPEYDRRAAEQGGPAAAEFFLRSVIGDFAFEKMPRVYRERSTAKYAEIRADSAALIAYRPRYEELASVQTPVLLLGGDRSAPYFLPTLEKLRDCLPHARLEIVAGAGHMLHAEASRRFAELLTAFADEIG